MIHLLKNIMEGRGFVKINIYSSVNNSLNKRNISSRETRPKGAFGSRGRPCVEPLVMALGGFLLLLLVLAKFCYQFLIGFYDLLRVYHIRVKY